MSWLQRIRRSERDLQDTAGPQGRPYLGIVTAYNPNTDKCSVAHFHEESMHVLHPYQGPNSWIRVAPETGSGVLLTERWDTQENEIVGYHNKHAERGIEQYSERRDVRRPLNQGEIEINSNGYAQTYHDNRGNLHLRGGLVWQTLDNDNLCIESKAPWHHRILSSHNSIMGLGDEERFGTVTRPAILSPATTIFKTAGILPLKEYYRSLASLRIPGGLLVEHHEGDVVDRLGLPVLATMSGAPARSVSTWYTETGASAKQQIDSLGNMGIDLPPTALIGFNLKAPAGNMFLSAGLVAGMSATTINMKTTGVWATGAIILDGLNWGTHVHVGPTGTTSGPLPG